MTEMTRERWLHLCEEAASEEDPGKFRAICLQLEHFLEEKKARLRLSPTCWICGRGVDLETCKIDWHGRAVHKQCEANRMSYHNRDAAIPQT